MKHLFRFALSAGLLGALLVGGTYACPRLTSRLGLNLAELAELQRHINANLKRAEELDRLSRLVYQNVERREQVMAAVRQGALDLFEAAARFRAISRDLPADHLQFVRLAYPCPTAEECYCRQVIHYLRGEALYHAESGATADEMEAALNARLREGPIRLPAE